MKVSFSLNKAKPTVKNAPSLKQPVAFASLEDDEPIDAAPTASSSSSRVDGNKKLAAQTTGVSRAMKKRMAEEKKVDQTVFEYDEVWDKMQEVKLRQKEKIEVESQVRKPKYINSLLQAATVRKLDHLRAEEKMIQREREAEGGEFTEKEQFVTQAYKDQMAEVRRAEEEEKLREEMEKAKKGPTTGMTHFYRQLLEQNEEQHSATVAATQKKPIGPYTPSLQNLTITKPADFTPVSDLERAKAARAEGKDVELNDDNQIVDSRDLLSAGLNLSAPNTRRLGLTLKSKSGAGGQGGSGSADGEEPPVVHRAVGVAASQREINERRRREIEQQLQEEKERTAQEHEERERERAQRMVAKRNNEEDVKSARERYLERKRRKLEGSTADESSAQPGETT